MITFLSLFIFISIPYFANAGVFSFFNFFGSSNKETTLNVSEIQNSQTMPILKAALNDDPNPAKGGGDILIVDDKALLATSGIDGDISYYKPKSDKIAVYEVREGDSLSQIAEMFGVSVNTIRWANNLEGVIQPGQTLIILPVTGVKHVIKTGGTVYDLAKIYNADAKEIALFNGISIDKELKAGDEIIVPNGEIKMEEEEKATKNGRSSSYTSSNKVDVTGYFIHPLPGSIKTQGLHGYNAVDFGASVGTPIRAAASGQVIISIGAGWNGGYGNYLVIRHDNGTQTLYAHLSSNAVGVGQFVQQGQTVGHVGNTGRSTGPHLHFEVRGGRNPF
jgi:LysM repeat protein